MPRKPHHHAELRYKPVSLKPEHPTESEAESWASYEDAIEEAERDRAEQLDEFSSYADTQPDKVEPDSEAQAPRQGDRPQTPPPACACTWSCVANGRRAREQYELDCARWDSAPSPRVARPRTQLRPRRRSLLPRALERDGEAPPLAPGRTVRPVPDSVSTRTRAQRKNGEQRHDASQDPMQSREGARAPADSPAPYPPPPSRDGRGG